MAVFCFSRETCEFGNHLHKSVILLSACDAFFYGKSSKKEESFSGPKGGSLEAQKVWFMEVVQRLTKEGTEIKLTEEEWIAGWTEYWIEEYNR